jgi:hypothetical protein
VSFFFLNAFFVLSASLLPRLNSFVSWFLLLHLLLLLLLLHLLLVSITTFVVVVVVVVATAALQLDLA